MSGYYYTLNSGQLPESNRWQKVNEILWELSATSPNRHWLLLSLSSGSNCGEQLIWWTYPTGALLRNNYSSDFQFIQPFFLALWGSSSSETCWAKSGSGDTALTATLKTLLRELTEGESSRVHGGDSTVRSLAFDISSPVIYAPPMSL